jgi:hypothetical protein
VSGKHKVALLLLLFSLSTISIGTSCSSQMAREDDPAEETVQTADDFDEEEVVESDDGAFDEEGSESGSQKTAGFLMAIGYLAVTVGSALLPLLMM